ncbi:hypothetical protein [Clostridium beijerinckii]|nr:hypothetical protein [Clostridium beijerinckii]NRX18959.1 hypothetical protein [Clostridium beijerinckii]
MSKRLLKLVSTVCMTVLIGSAFVGCEAAVEMVVKVHREVEIQLH